MSQKAPETYIPTIGLEIHLQLNTKRKMFTHEGYRYGAPPNTQTTPVTLAHPGTLPTINREAINHAIRLTIAIGGTITPINWFDRKNYTYQDLPKGYQITQDKSPISRGGEITIQKADGSQKAIPIQRIQIEEDTGKSIHTPHEKRKTLVNFDRAGVPLLEVVTEPHIDNATEAMLFLREIRKLVRHLEICNAKMEEGSMRCDANISLRPAGTHTYGTKVEVKNLNSISQVGEALTHESTRQHAILSTGGTIQTHTRGYDEKEKQTRYQRAKQSLTGYRFFTDPDLLPFEVDKTWIDSVRNAMPPLPEDLRKKWQPHNLPPKQIESLLEEKEAAILFEATTKHTTHHRSLANWIMGPIKAHLNNQKLTWQSCAIPPEKLAALVNTVEKGTISFSAATKSLLQPLLTDPTIDFAALLQRQAPQVDNHTTLLRWVEEALATYPQKVEAYRQGKKGVLGLFMGLVMKKSNRKANPEKTQQLLLERLQGKSTTPT